MRQPPQKTTTPRKFFRGPMARQNVPAKSATRCLPVTCSRSPSRWLAYTSDESGRPAIYVQSFPAFGGKWRVSTHGGAHPRWRRSDGKELFYLDGRGNTLMAVTVKGDFHTFEADAPVALFGVNIGRFISGPIVSCCITRPGPLPSKRSSRTDKEEKAQNARSRSDALWSIGNSALPT
jgi:hypothetical protein